MTSGLPESLDFARWHEPEPSDDLRVGLTLWLEYQRHEFQRKWRDLDPGQLAAWSVPPVELSVLGLIRHMQQMEHGYRAGGSAAGIGSRRTATTITPAACRRLVLRHRGVYLSGA